MVQLELSKTEANALKEILELHRSTLGRKLTFHKQPDIEQITLEIGMVYNLESQVKEAIDDES